MYLPSKDRMRSLFFNGLILIYAMATIGIVVFGFWMERPWDIYWDNPYDESLNLVLAGIALVMVFLFPKVYWICGLASMPPDERQICRNLSKVLSPLIRL